MQIRHHQQQRGRSQAGPRQRKWSDWSECTADCVKVRHRFICDDILRVEQESSKNRTITHQSTTTTTERVLIKRNQDQQAESSRDDELLNNAEDDYADDGDEIEPDVDTDLCDKVDTSKTFEEAPCVGGLCKLPSLYLNQVTPATTTPAATQPPARHRHHNLKHKASLSDKDSKDADSEVPANFRSATNFAAGRQLPHSVPRHNKSLEAPGPFEGSQSQIQTRRLAGSHKPIGQRAGELVQPEGGLRNSSSPSNSQQLEQAGSVWTKAIWPTRQLLAASGGPGLDNGNGLGEQYGGASPQALLIQWTILIGSLLAIILLILLILRKLLATAFPSYHWMLAKQMIKSTSDRLGINSLNSAGAGGKRRLADNCCPAAHPHQHRCLGSLPAGQQHFSCAGSSGALLLAETTNQSPTSSSNIQTHLCYSCHHQLGHQKHHRNQMLPLDGAAGNHFGDFVACPTTTSSLKTSTNGPLPCIVDLNGRHLLGGSLNAPEQACATRFNTDLDLITPAMDPPSYVYASMTQSSTNSSRRQHYDTVNNDYSTASLGYEDPLNLVPERVKAYIVPSKVAPGAASGGDPKP